MNNKGSNSRLKWLIAFQVIFAAAIIINFFILMVIKGPQSNGDISYDSRRGDIYDASGVALALHKQFFSLEIIPNFIKDKELVFNKLLELGVVEEERLNQTLYADSSKTFILNKKIEYEKSSEIKDFISENQINGIFLREFFGRTYPHNEIASHVVGYVNYKNDGMTGIEGNFDHQLKSKNKIIGNSIFTTIDITSQYFAEAIIDEAVEAHNPDNIILLIMEAKTGRILAWAANPAYDPNNLNNSTENDRKNYPASFTYEPGSVFKIFSLSAALELGSITPDDVFNNPGYFIIPGTKNERIGDLTRSGRMTLEDVIRESSNVGTALAVEEISNQNFYNKLYDFGFSQLSGVQLGFEEKGLLRPTNKWSNRSKFSIAMGQEISTTAVQIVSAATVFANNGIRMKPIIIDRIESPDGKILQEFKPQAIKSVISPNVAKIMLDMMHSASETGTAWRSRVSGINISSKTGTAQIFDSKLNKYSDTKYFASCLTLLPTEDPELILYVGITNPKGDEYYGGRIAAPIIHKIAEQMILHLGIKRSSDTVISHTGQISYKNMTVDAIGEVMPDFKGLSKRELINLYKIEGLKIRFVGEGWVKSQSPPPGTPITKETVIELRFE